MAVLLTKARYKNHLGNIREQANKGGDTINELDAGKPIYRIYLCSLIYQVKYDILVLQIVGHISISQLEDKTCKKPTKIIVLPLISEYFKIKEMTANLIT